jgi:DNA-binding transcriptional LysR family regulator
MSVQKSSERLDWDALRYFRAVAQLGTLSAAARRLKVQHTTVARRIDALEASLGSRLFLRNPRGYTPTRVGLALLESVEAMHVRVDEVARLADGQDIEMSGVVRIATADALAKHVVLPALAPLAHEHPELCLEVVSDTRQHDLSRREADIALRIGASLDTRLVGRKLSALGFGLYAARPRPKKLQLERVRYVAFDEAVGKLPHETWLAEYAAGARVVLRSNRQETLTEAVRLGIGLGLLPCLTADGDPGLVRWLGPNEVFTRELWLLVHPDLQASRRVRAVMDALSQWVVRQRARVAGN